MQNKFTIEEIKTYLLSKDSMGDILYFLSEKNIIEANIKANTINNDDDE